MARETLKVAQRLKQARQFTLLEIMVALGVMAIGMTAALGLLTAATTTGRRAENQVQAALVADYAFSEMQSKLSNEFNHAELPGLSAEDGAALRGTSEGEPVPSEGDEDNEDGESDSGAGPKVLLRPENPIPGYEDYKVWGLLTPVEPTVTNSAQPDPEKPRAFLAEVHVVWSFKGRKRSTVFHNILLRRLRFSDLPKKTN